MKQKLLYLLLLLLTVLSVAPTQPLWGGPVSQNAGPTLVGDTNAIGAVVAAANRTTVQPALRSQSILTRDDYRRIYAQAQSLLATGANFRLNNLQLPPSCQTLEECKLNYQNFNSGQLFYGFCSDYDRISPSGLCPGDTPGAWPQPLTNIRGQLARARTLFGFLALTEPADLTIEVSGRALPMRTIGVNGVVSATRELATIHLIFGNEFMVDAIDYRFGGNDPRADQIIAEELNQLRMAQQQFELAFDVLAHAFNSDLGGVRPTYIGDFFDQREYKLFGILSERLVAVIGEMADRYRQMGQEAKALELYAQAFATQYVQAMALANSARQQNAKFLENGGFEIINNLERLRSRAQAIHDGVNPFGFVDNYVPLQTYEELRRLVQADFLRDATEDENRAENAQREFDQNRTALLREIQNLRLTYDTRLLEICGPSTDNYLTCLGDGGVMKQNFFQMIAASERLNQIKQRQQNLLAQVQIEEERAKQVIKLTLKNGDIIAATAIAQGVLNAYRKTETKITTRSHNIHAGVEVTSELEWSLNPFSWAKTGTKIFAGYRYEWSRINSTQEVWDPAAIELAKLESAQALQQAVNEAAIIGANSAATIKTLLLQTSELAIEESIQLQEMNRLAAEHNDLVQQYEHFLNLREQARVDLIDSNLANPAFRLLRDQTTLEASRSINVAAQFAYLTAKALESEFLVRYPSLDRIFMARTADDIDNFVNDLEAFRVAIGSPGERNRYPYRISVARDLFGLSDQNLDPNGTLSPAERARLRFESFQALLQRSTITNTATGQVIGIELPFATSLLNNSIFTPNVWNNRIAGVGLPVDVPNTQGIAINVLTQQFGDIGTPEVQLTHDGHASYRTVTGALVAYVPENAKLAGFATPPGFESKSKTATILSSVNGNGRGVASSALFNRSVAVSNWTLRIDLRSPFNSKLDLSQLEDLEINMDTTGIALANSVEAAHIDTERLQASFAQTGPTEER